MNLKGGGKPPLVPYFCLDEEVTFLKIKNGYKHIVIIGCLFCYLFFLPEYCMASMQYYSITELRKTTPKIWEIPISNDGSKIEVPIFIPEVDRFPVLRAKWDEISEKEARKLLSDEIIAECDDYGFAYYMNWMTKPEGSRFVEMQINRIWSVLPRITLSEKVYDSSQIKYEYISNCADVYAKNQKMSLEDAIVWAENCFESMYKSYNYGMFVDSVKVNSPYYYSETLENYPFGDLTGVGCYSVIGYQTVRGVPVFDSIIHGCDVKRVTNLVNALARDAAAKVWDLSSNESYLVYGFPWKETGVLMEDIPLCSFNAIKDVLQKEIDSGKMKEIYTIKLGYVIFADNDQEYTSGKEPWKNEEFLLVPTWVVECSYTENPDKNRTYPRRESADAYDYRSHDWLYEKWMFNAQTGERYYSNGNSDSWCYAPLIIEW